MAKFYVVALAAVTPILPLQAEQRSTVMEVSATVVRNCEVTASPLSFGTINLQSGKPYDLSQALSVTCTNGTGWSVSTDVEGAAGARQMTSAEGALKYALYTDAARQRPWGDGVRGQAIAGIGTGSKQSAPIYARVLADQAGTAPGAYRDLVVITITY